MAIADHAIDYKTDAWRQYSVEELGNWVHLLVKRSYHRNNQAKAIKDLADARNYLDMIVEHISAAEQAV